MPLIIITIFTLLLGTTLPARAQRAKAVDLGLSVKWADCNVGASSPDQYGDYYAWGEIKPKHYYGYYSAYKHYTILKHNGNNKRIIRKYSYVPLENYGLDNLIELQPTDDAATRRMGSAWRTPTLQEYEELQQKCTFTPTIYRGTHGFWVKNRTAPSDSIFLPMTGYKDYGNIRHYPGTQGHYWTRNLIGDEIHNDSLMNAKMTDFVLQAKCAKITNEGTFNIDFMDRRNGCAIRAVRKN